MNRKLENSLLQCRFASPHQTNHYHLVTVVIAALQHALVQRSNDKLSFLCQLIAFRCVRPSKHRCRKLILSKWIATRRKQWKLCAHTFLFKYWLLGNFRLIRLIIVNSSKIELFHFKNILNAYNNGTNRPINLVGKLNVNPIYFRTTLDAIQAENLAFNQK